MRPLAPNPFDRQGLAVGIFIVLVMIGLTLWVHSVNAATPFINDELAYLWQARVLATGHLTARAPEHAEFVNIPPLIVEGNSRVSWYPIGFPLALVPWVLAGIPWGLNVLLGGLSLLLLYDLVRRLDGIPTAFVATALMALSPFFVAQSTIFLSHPLTLALALALLHALLRRELHPRRLRWPTIAGACIGYAGNVSPFIAVPMFLIVIERAHATRRVSPVTRREVLAFALPLLAGLAIFLGTNLGTTGSPWKPAYYLESHVRAGFGEEVGLGGYTPSRALANTIDRLDLLNEMLFGWPLSSFVFAAVYALATITRRFRRQGAPRVDGWDRTLTVLFLSTIAIYAFWYHAGVTEDLGPRFLYATIPTMTIFTARGVLGLGNILKGWLPENRLVEPLGRAASALCLLGLVGAGTIPYLARMPNLERPRERRAVRAFLDDLEARGIRHGTVFLATRSITKGPPLLYASGFDDSRDLVFARDLGRLKNRAFLRARAGAPVYIAEFEEKTLTWRLREQREMKDDDPGTP